MENIFDTVICLKMEKTFKAKTPSGEFKVTTLKNLLLLKQAVTSKRNPNTQYQPIVEPLPQCPIVYCSGSLSVQCMNPST